MKNEKITPPEGYQDRISQNEFAGFLREFIMNTSDEEAVQIWKMIAQADPTIALKVVLANLKNWKIRRINFVAAN